MNQRPGHFGPMTYFYSYSRLEMTTTIVATVDERYSVLVSYTYGGNRKHASFSECREFSLVCRIGEDTKGKENSLWGKVEY